jgi:membrane protein
MSGAGTDVREAGPDKPTDLPKQGWKETVKRTVSEFRDDNLTDWAAALTYYAVQALFPALIVLVALIGIFGSYPQTTNSIFKIITDAGAPQSTVDAVRTPLEGVIRSKGGAGALLGVGLLGALWSASGYIGAFMRASNSVYEVREGRPFWKLRPLQILVTIVMVMLLALILVALVVSGSLAQAVGNAIGIGSTAVTVFNIAKWPVILVVIMGMVATLYYVAPNVKQPKVRWVSPGGVVAVILWILASAAFAFYVSNFGSYNKTYGTLGAVISLLVWLWITNLALLFGIEFDSELERARELHAGLPAEDEIQLPPRQAPKGAENGGGGSAKKLDAPPEYVPPESGD